MYGLLQRSEKKYDEAIKCYRNALKWDKVRCNDKITNAYWSPIWSKINTNQSPVTKNSMTKFELID